jgi:GTP-dependent phosphoenolpyruvate carboxykinase
MRSCGATVRRRSTTACASRWWSGTFIKLNEEKRPGQLPGRGATRATWRAWRIGPYICSINEGGRGPDQQLDGPGEMKDTLNGLFDGFDARAHDVRDPVQHGPGRFADRQIGVQITDSPYVVVNMRIMTRMGRGARGAGRRRLVRPCMHSVGACRWPTGRRTCRGRAAPTRRKVHRAFPRGRARSGPTARATAATRCWARSAWRCASPR